MSQQLPEWSDSRTAALFLRPCTPKHLNEELGASLTRKSGNRFGTGHARSGGWWYHRHDLERVRAIMDALGCSANKAVWLLLGIRTLGSRKLLEHLELTLDDSINRVAMGLNRADYNSNKRRFQ